eukprot:154605_1
MHKSGWINSDFIPKAVMLVAEEFAEEPNGSKSEDLDAQQNGDDDPRENAKCPGENVSDDEIGGGPDPHDACVPVRVNFRAQIRTHAQIPRVPHAAQEEDGAENAGDQ